jgi:hypothetical protein
MKKPLFFLFMMVTAVFYLNAQTITNREDPFTGPSAKAAEWMKKREKSFRKIASDASFVIIYSGEKEANGSNDVTLLLYDYADIQKGRLGTVLEINENSTGNIIYVVWTNESSDDKAVFFNDNDKRQLDVSFSTKMKKYGMGSDTVTYVKTIVKEFK